MTSEAKILTGRISIEQLEGSAEFPWFDEGYSQNPLDEIEPTLLDSLKKLASTGNLSVLAFIGTWCPDCHYWVPRLVRLMDEVNLPREAIQMLGLDRSKAFEPDTSNFGVERLPTFIFLYDGREIGRVIEEPRGNSLIQAIASFEP